jgi:DNA repair protein RecN (Recombination protein N)
MLLQLKIHNIALIDDLTVEFTEGMNCLTGETGAGKSIVIDSIECILGGRTSKDIIKTGQESAYVDGLFCCNSEKITEFFNEIGIPEEPDNTIVIHRDMNISGRNVCRINGCMTTVSMLKKLGNLLIDIHTF